MTPEKRGLAWWAWWTREGGVWAEAPQWAEEGEPTRMDEAPSQLDLAEAEGRAWLASRKTMFTCPRCGHADEATRDDLAAPFTLDGKPGGLEAVTCACHWCGVRAVVAVDSLWSLEEAPAP